jgi:hypothetical protein
MRWNIDNVAEAELRQSPAFLGSIAGRSPLRQIRRLPRAEKLKNFRTFNE